ncbi:hypothetical protein HOP50_02g10310 [Chloropicon primus]|uniref:Uncharacterized protein n=1 Tax=Chloropicon primus TaxID=1764295 RepID=A0A5B8MDR5_9CHLO|nr:hypothetical protein A3770_02p10450 [Chloropicon primus]UPQ97736.1 hypothetical protein HOP50_02g10310 [Chloropicon primus]|mmetsp:Transcript_12643/g.35272  ORF Transcript_12643/g.35272 Transcript_12643/m.35272 type:complete len:243 (-) Transcript_12643:78-806(-)|eukprot:QDZ18527.1 hypothetical protein A3770_02p10450 [Chloropicon primus]
MERAKGAGGGRGVRDDLLELREVLWRVWKGRAEEDLEEDLEDLEACEREDDGIEGIEAAKDATDDDILVQKNFVEFCKQRQHHVSRFSPPTTSLAQDLTEWKCLPAIDSQSKVSVWLRTASLLDFLEEKEDQGEDGGSREGRRAQATGQAKLNAGEFNAAIKRDLLEFCSFLGIVAKKEGGLETATEGVTDCTVATATHSVSHSYSCAHSKPEQFSCYSMVSGYSPSRSSSFVVLETADTVC